MNKNKIYLLFCLVLLSGCATWSPTAGSFVNSSAKYSVDLPWGWMFHRGKELLLTKDGIWLENIVITRHNIKDKLEYTKKRFTKGMIPEEISEVVLDDLRSDNKMGNLEVIENSPVTISGINGFKLVYTFTTEDGLKKRCVHYGFGYEDWVYKISYTGTTWHYFDKEAVSFNGLVRSFKFLGYTGHTGYKETFIETEEIKEKPKETHLVAVETKPTTTTYAEYYRLLYNTIAKAVVKPEDSGSGVINASLTLLSDGTLEDVQILDGSSEEDALRDAVIKAIRDSSPFPAFPEDMKDKTKEIFTITIEFRQR